ncbi:hypothetical protein B9Z07_17890 [Burkholderia cenocepacia]|uniref:Uncharacterized protein n=1 Tax=Burkholderia cenocepacia TaxID=95486 RepID=A0AAD0J1B5_9BURK|nr:hypothetical protein B9Z07_17890 [Burkholderia cenocepacia]PRE33280.1 hypothetical protein C6P63_29755 [Burkholderia cenocepacia]
MTRGHSPHSSDSGRRRDFPHRDARRAAATHGHAGAPVARLSSAAAARFVSRRSCTVRMHAAPVAAPPGTGRNRGVPFASGVTLIRAPRQSRYTRKTYPQKAVSMLHVLLRPPAHAAASAWRCAAAPPPAAGHR